MQVPIKGTVVPPTAQGPPTGMIPQHPPQQPQQPQYPPQQPQYPLQQPQHPTQPQYPIQQPQQGGQYPMGGPINPYAAPAGNHPQTINVHVQNTGLAPASRESTTGLIASGYICGLLSILFCPPALGLAGFVIGIVNLTKGSVGHGIAQIIISVTCGVLGMILGAAVSQNYNYY